MPYLIDRQRALFSEELVAVEPIRQRWAKSRVILRDNSLYQTLTRARTLVRHATDDWMTYSKGVRWRKRHSSQLNRSELNHP